MNESPDPNDAAAANAAGELARVQGKIEEARALLVRLLQDVVAAESRMSRSQAALLLEANEELVLAALHAQTDADTAAHELSEVSQSAALDALTRLPNRVLLLDRFARAIANAKRSGARVALLFLDLDNFKQINDTLGHAVGDEVLREVAQRAASSIRAADTVGRHGGDEFLILLTEVSEPSDAGLIADKVISAIGAQGFASDPALRVSASVGISVYPDDGEDADTLIKRADAAMYRAKRQGPGSFALHSQAPVGEAGAESPAGASLQQPLIHHDRARSEHDRRNAQLREANERLVLAVLSAQELQAAAEQAQRRQTEFMAVVAHELQNPLAPIRIATAMLGRVGTDEPLLQRAQAILDRQVARMSRFVHDLVDVSRSSTGTLRLECSVVDMAGVIEAAVDACAPAVDTRLQHLDVKVPAGAIELWGDPIRLEQVLGNLLDNASKYSHDGGRIGLSVELAGDSIVMTVSDSGIGIAADALPNVFEPFVQDAHAIGFNGDGPGIGLTVVRALVQAHSGTVVARSAGRGLGSQFVVTLPLAGTSPLAKSDVRAVGRPDPSR